ncbi:Integral membrane protein TerC family protein [compost metagenome]
MWAAIRTIIIADTMMGLDNVLAVAGAADGHFTLVVIGLAISIPIMVWGSTLILKLTDRYPFVITIGAAVLVWTASKMIIDEPLIHSWFVNGWVKYGFEIICIVIVLAIGTYAKKNQEKKRQIEQALKQGDFPV